MEHTFKLETGLELVIDSDNTRAMAEAIGAFLIKGNSAFDFVCPYCQCQMTHLHDTIDGSMYTDTYTCDANCMLLMTVTTPIKHMFYQDTPVDQSKVLIEFMDSDHPSFWDK